MGKNVRILIIDDSQEDADMISQTLRDAGISAEYERVDNARSLAAVLAQEPWDIALCDYDLPGFGAPEAIEQIKAADSDVPIIMISGLISEENLVAFMKAGGSDVVVKQNLVRLAPAIERLLSEAELRKSNRRAQDYIKVLASLAEESPSPILRVDTSGCVLFSNKGSEPLLDLWACRETLIVPDDILKICGICHSLGTEYYIDVPCADNLVYSLMFVPLREIGYTNIYGLDISERVLAETRHRESEERFRQVTENIREVFWLTDPNNNRMIYISPAYEGIWGRSCASLYENPASFIDGIHPQDRAAVAAALGKQVRGGYDETYRVVRGDGSIRWVRDRAFPVADAQGKIYRVAGIAEDITEQKAEGQRTSKLSQALEQTADSVIITDISGKIEYVNPAFTEMTGYPQEDVLGKNPRFLKSGRHEEKFYRHLWDTILSGEPYWDTFINRKNDGSLYYEEKTITPLKDAAGNITHFVATGKEITYQMVAEERLHRLAFYDSLTGLPNRTLFMERLEHALIRQHDLQGTLAVMLLDLDRFKTINNTLGYDVGDQLLQEISRRLLAAVPKEDSVARMGGDEFAVLLESAPSSAHISATAEKILASVSQFFNVSGRELFVTASIGIGIYPDSAKEAAVLIQNVDTAMYHAKEMGRNTYQFYAAHMSAKAVERLTFENALRRALEREEFVLHYQPQVSLVSGQITGVEALIRWQHPELGLVNPTEFIPLLEETGLIVPVGEWVLTTACAQNKTWQESELPELRMDVNLSPRQFLQADLLVMVERALKHTKLESKYLGLEITEGSIIRDTEKAIVILKKLREMGVSLSIDDFGTGYSSLSYLKRMPIGAIKIDRSFIRDITTDPDSAAIVRSIIALSHSIKLEVVGEGAETEAQTAYLRKLNCDALQGYYFSEPLPADGIASILREGRCLPLDSEVQAETTRRTLLILDDEKNITTSLKRTLRRDGYQIFTANRAEEAFDLLATNIVNVIISDQRMPEMSGTEFLLRAKDLYPDTVRIVLSGYTELEVITDAINKGAIYKFLTKPWDDDLLRANIREAFEYYEMLQERKRH